MSDIMRSDIFNTTAAADAEVFRFPAEIGALRSVEEVGNALLRRMLPLGFDPI